MKRKPKEAEQINAERFGGLILQMWLLSAYGPRLDMRQLAKVLQIAPGHVFNQVSEGTFPVRTYLDGKGRFADFRDVAMHLEQCRHAIEEETHEHNA